jgi:dienelactone hydrolase
LLGLLLLGAPVGANRPLHPPTLESAQTDSFSPVHPPAMESARTPLESLVGEYLSTPDAERAAELLGEILSREDSSLSAIGSIVGTRRTYKSAPVGIQPEQELSVASHVFEYGLYVPETYRPETAYPLVICLHGAGFTGDAYLERWQARLGEHYILACPTLRYADWWTRTAEHLVLATIRAVTDIYHVDPDRIFLTGMSNGGIGAYIIGAHHASRFAAVIPMASGIDTVLMPFLQNFQQTPLYIIHGKRDQVMPVELSRSIVDTLSELNYSHVYREHDRIHPMAGGHFFPREELGDLVAWLGQQHRNPYPKKLRVVADASHLRRFGWVRIDMTDRIASFTEALVDRMDEAIRSRLYARLDATIRDNTITVQSQRVRRYTLYLNEQLVDLARPITVMTNETVAFNDVVTPSVRTLLHEARVRQDEGGVYTVSLTIDVPADDIKLPR